MIRHDAIGCIMNTCDVLSCILNTCDIIGLSFNISDIIGWRILGDVIGFSVYFGFTSFCYLIDFGIFGSFDWGLYLQLLCEMWLIKYIYNTTQFLSDIQNWDFYHISGYDTYN
jgi:hypothetical protein